MNPILTAEDWRKRAEEARAIAETMNDDLSRNMMRQIADDYEKLAVRAEAREKQHRN